MNHINSLSLAFFCLYLGISNFSWAQKGSISGEILDQNSDEVIPFASIAAVDDIHNGIVKGIISDEDGYFKITKVPFGRYTLVISFMGYVSDTLSNILVDRTTPDIELGKLRLQQHIVNLEEVEIRSLAATAVTELDRRRYNADDFEIAKGGTAVDLLNKLPATSVGPDGNVSVRGTADFMVYLNGKPTQLEPSVLLAQLSADAVENIEVITVPTARYDAQGKGGIVNVVTKRSGTAGLSIAANALAGGAPWGHLKDDLSGCNMNDYRHGGGVNVSYVKNNVSLFGGLYYNKKNVNGDRVGDARILQENGSYFHMVASGERPEWYENFTANVGADFTLSERSTLSTAYYYGNRTEGRSAFYVYNNFYGDVDKDPLAGIPENEAWIYNPNTDNRYGIFHSGNIDYEVRFDNNAALTTSFLYEHSSLSRKLDNRDYAYRKPSEIIGPLQRHFIQQDDAPLDGFRISLDYEKTYDNGHQLSWGLQPQILSHSGTFLYDTFNVDQEAWGDYTALENSVDLFRGVYAGYVDYSGSLKKLEFALGLRLEYTDQTLDMSNSDYFNIFDRPSESRYEVNQLDWFPTVHLSWLASETDHLIMAASRRISRPPTKNMAPFLYRRHFEVYVVGDPALEPEYISTIELTYDKTIAKQNVALTGFYRGTENAVFRVNTVFEEENVLIRSYTNAGNAHALGAELNANLQTGTRVKLFLGGSLYNYRVEGNIFGYRENNQSINWSMKGNFNWQVTKAFKISADVDFKSATVTAQGENELFYLANTAITYTPKQLEGWSFALRGIDLLASNIQALNTRAFNSEGVQIFYQEVQYNRYGPILELGVNFAFNSNGKTSKRPGSTFGDEQF